MIEFQQIIHAISYTQLCFTWNIPPTSHIVNNDNCHQSPRVISFELHT